jgi:hypothetical protein
LDHLQRLTDRRGLLCAAVEDRPDPLQGYRAVDNADALRLCVASLAHQPTDRLLSLAQTCFDMLLNGQTGDGRVHHHCDIHGRWTDDQDDDVVQSRLARALAAVLASDLPIELRLTAGQWWDVLVDRAAWFQSPIAAANWLMAIQQLDSEESTRHVTDAQKLAAYLDKCYSSTRWSDWEWFEPDWQPEAAGIPNGLFAACSLLGGRRHLEVAEITTRFIIDHLFEDGLFLPVGTRGGWSAFVEKAVFDQTPAEALSVVELLCTAGAVTLKPVYGEYADYALRWFTGNNFRGECLIDPATGGCASAITSDGTDTNLSASATVACLLAHEHMAERTVVVEEPTVYVG